MKTKAAQTKWQETAFRLIAMVVASFIFAVNYKSFISAGDLFPGGL